jgi:hypothetical protein
MQRSWRRELKFFHAGELTSTGTEKNGEGRESEVFGRGERAEKPNFSES